jgi:hypothetical protein
MSRHIIDCNSDPYIPESTGNFWRLKSHKKQGKMVWDSSKIHLHLETEQKISEMKGDDLYKRVKDRAPLNANVLDYLLKHTECIPHEWKSKGKIFFFGTIYYVRGFESARFLNWNGNEWRSDYVRLNYEGFSSSYVSAII